MNVLVVGGGMGGLAAAHALARAGAGVTLVERSPVLGGKVATDRVDGFVVERGPDSFLTVRPAALELCRELGLAADVTPPLEPHDVFVWHHDRLVPVPEGTGLGVPTRVAPFLASPLFSPREKLRAALEVAIRDPGTAGDVSIGAFLRRRFGDAVVDRFAGPLISGIYGAGIDELSLDALMPRLRDAALRHGSLVRAGLAARGARRPAASAPQVVTLRHGMGSLVDALAARLAATDVRMTTGLELVERSGSAYAARLHGSLVRAGFAARGTARTPAGPLLVTLRRGMGSLVDALAARLGRTDVRLGVGLARLERIGPRYVAHLDDGTRVGADAVVLATPAGAAARALGDLAPAAADALATITYRGTAAVALAYDERQLSRPLGGHGFVVPDGALAIAACTWSSAKWPDRAPSGAVLLRATIRSDALLAGDDGALADAAHRSLTRAIGITGRPVLVHVVRWDAAMPRYTVGHLERLARVEAALAPHPGIVLAGAAYRGTGVADCVAQGRAAAARILAAERAAA